MDKVPPVLGGGCIIRREKFRVGKGINVIFDKWNQTWYDSLNIMNVL
jgi:hypothetical protein